MTKLTEYLSNLEHLDLISLTKNHPYLEYTFKHIFTRESIYGSLLLSDRRHLHQQIGYALESTFSDGIDDTETALLLAYHFEQSDDQERALKYLQFAAEDAYINYANQEAKALHSRALALLEPNDYMNRWKILAQQEKILDRLGERDQQVNILIQMQTLAELMVDRERLTMTHNRRAAYFDKVSEYQAAFEAAEAGLRVARRSGNEHLQAQSLNTLALAAWRRFDYPQVQHWAIQALDVLKVVGDPSTRIVSLFHLGKAGYRLGQYDLALQYCQAAQELTVNTDDRDKEATSHLILGWIYQRLGDYDLATEHFQKKLDIRHTIGDSYGEATALSHLGWLAYDQQIPEVGLEYCQQALDISQRVNDRENEAYALSGMGLNYEQLGNLAKATESYQTALALHKKIGATTLAIFDQTGLARLALGQSDLPLATDYITPVADWVLSGNAQKFWDPWIIYLSSYQVLSALDKTDTAITILEEAHTLLHQRIEQISNEKLRECFTEKVTVNKQLEQAWQAWQT